MSRHLSTEAFQMDIRSSPSQQHLEPSRSSSLQSAPDELDGDGPADRSGLGGARRNRSHKLDLYSVPVFLLEVVVLAGLVYGAYYIHFQYDHQPLISGFYCDDISYRQQFLDSKFIQAFTRPDNELVVLSLLLAVPIVTIIFCELVNSMFGALKFRQIRALCACCKLHSITRRTIRFSGAYALGFLLVMISCDILANTSGRLRPYFAQECHSAYDACLSQAALASSLAPSTHLAQGRDLTGPAPTAATTTTIGDQPAASADLVSPLPSGPPSGNVSSLVGAQASPLVMEGSELLGAGPQARQQTAFIVERQWIDLTGVSLKEVCKFHGGDEVVQRRFQQLAMSWPSFPAAMFTYACLFLAIYLSYVGTARPLRIITTCLVMSLLLLATAFDFQLIKEHYNHWDDAASGAFLALVVAVFVLLVYLNRFRDTHYYENQKLHSQKRLYGHDNYRASMQEGPSSQYNLDKSEGATQIVGGATQNGDVNGNDLAMRYFQIPRANYRGAPRPLSSLNQMR